MVGKIEHIGIAVKDLESANALYTRLLGISPYKQEIVESEGVHTSFFMAGVNKIELLQGINEGNAISSFIEKRGEGIHHIAFHVEDIEAEMARLKAEGFRLIHEKPKRGADNKLICFVHPKDSQGVLIELCQDINEEKNIKK
ncbi:MAG: methylmalonyl-CoA epimerase [Flavobacteriales bacterium]|nr:methylmalonyl-CoA epimerase [Flavobacteriales bacterium]